MKRIHLILVSLFICLGCFYSYSATLNLNLFIECYYLGSGQMQPVLLNCGAPNATGVETDTIIVELHDTAVTSTVVASAKAILMSYGSATVVFDNSVIGGSYYIAVKQKISLETWSAVPVLMSATTNYDFTSAQSQAYGSNMVQVDFSPDEWAFICGDINQDGNIDHLDFPPLDYGINNSLFGCFPADLNGDGNVDLLDIYGLDTKQCSGLYAHFP